MHVELRCRHISIISAERFNRYCLLRGWNTQLATLHYRLKCAASGWRLTRVKASTRRGDEDRFPHLRRVGEGCIGASATSRLSKQSRHF